jgi:hypothetical protein
LTILLKKNLSNLKIIDLFDFDVISLATSARFIDQALYLIDRFNLENDYKFWSDLACTSRSPLANVLLKEIAITIFCIQTVIESDCSIKIYGLNPAQEKTVLDFFGESKFLIDIKVRIFLSISQFASILKLSAFMSYCFIFWMLKKHCEKEKDIGNVGLLTYCDRTQLNDDSDPYFGNLISKFNSTDDVAFYLGVVYFPYSPYLRKIKSMVYINAYNEISDYVAAYLKSFRLIFKDFNLTNLPFSSGKINFFSVYKYRVISGASSGYWETILIKQGLSNFIKNIKLKKIIYPFENKSIEKAILKVIPSDVKTIGYQHTSITNTHFNLKITTEEIQFKYLPDKIITCGSVTYDWLIEHSKIPIEKIVVGCGLRQQSIPALGKKGRGSVVKNILFVFSSSFHELTVGINYILEAIEQTYGLKFKIRAHPNFPVSGLANEVQKKLRHSQVWVSKTSLTNDFNWADAVIYISSTAAIDALRFGLPVICLNYNGMSFDPLMGRTVSNRYVVNDVKSLKRFLYLIEDNQIKLTNDAILGSDYALMYFREISDNNLKPFFD